MILKLVTVILLILPVLANSAEQTTQFNQKVDQLKRSVLELNKNLYQLEDELLNPATTKVAVYFSLNNGRFFQPSSISVAVNGKTLATHLYTEKQITALVQGAVQPLQYFNTGLGEQELKVVVKGMDQNGKEKELVSEQKVNKTDKPLYLEIKVADLAAEQKAELSVSQW